MRKLIVLVAIVMAMVITGDVFAESRCQSLNRRINILDARINEIWWAYGKVDSLEWRKIKVQTLYEGKITRATEKRDRLQAKLDSGKYADDAERASIEASIQELNAKIEQLQNDLQTKLSAIQQKEEQLASKRNARLEVLQNKRDALWQKYVQYGCDNQLM